MISGHFLVKINVIESIFITSYNKKLGLDKENKIFEVISKLILWFNYHFTPIIKYIGEGTVSQDGHR